MYCAQSTDYVFRDKVEQGVSHLFFLVTKPQPNKQDSNATCNENNESAKKGVCETTWYQLVNFEMALLFYLHTGTFQSRINRICPCSQRVHHTAWRTCYLITQLISVTNASMSIRRHVFIVKKSMTWRAYSKSIYLELKTPDNMKSHPGNWIMTYRWSK